MFKSIYSKRKQLFLNCNTVASEVDLSLDDWVKIQLNEHFKDKIQSYHLSQGFSPQSFILWGQLTYIDIDLR